MLTACSVQFSSVATICGKAFSIAIPECNTGFRFGLLTILILNPFCPDFQNGDDYRALVSENKKKLEMIG